MIKRCRDDKQKRAVTEMQRRPRRRSQISEKHREVHRGQARKAAERSREVHRGAQRARHTKMSGTERCGEVQRGAERCGEAQRGAERHREVEAPVHLREGVAFIQLGLQVETWTLTQARARGIQQDPGIQTQQITLPCLCVYLRHVLAYRHNS